MCVESVALLGLDDKFWEKKFFAGQIEPFYTHFTHFKKSEENQPILTPPLIVQGTDHAIDIYIYYNLIKTTKYSMFIYINILQVIKT